MADKFNAGFVRDEQGRLALSTAPAKEGWVSGFVRDEEGRLVVVGPEGESLLPPSVASISTGEGAPAKGLTLNRLYIQVEGSKHIALWRGKGAGEEPELVAALSGIPADGSVTALQVAAANIDGNAGVPSMRTLVTTTPFTEGALDTENASRKSVATALVALMGRFRNLMSYGAKGLTTAAEAGKKYFAVPSNSDTTTFTPGTTNGVQYYPIKATDFAVTGLTPKLRLAILWETVATAPAVTITFGLYKVSVGATGTLGTLVEGSGIAIATPAKETAERVESADFAVPADGNYAVGYTVSGTPLGIVAFPAVILQIHHIV